MRNLLLFSILFLVHTTLTDAQKTPVKETQSTQLVSFDLNEEKLLDIVNKLAGLKQVNILLPNDQKKLGETTVTFKLGYKISVSKAWEMMITMLDIAGYALISHNNNLFEILPSNTIRNCSAPLYINTKTEIIKSSEATIRYLYYFQNINLKEKDIKTNLETILKDMLPGQPEDQKEQSFLVYEQHNSLLITGKANAIKSVVDIIRELDQGRFSEAIEVIPVLHTNANEIVDIINKLKPKAQDDETFRFPPLVAEPKNSKTYFSASSRIIAITQTNSVAIFGLYESVQRIKDFIQKYLDKSIDAEKTILHVKPLKYLVSKDFAATLDNFVKQKAAGAQSTGKNTDNIFNNIIIQAEEMVIAESKERKWKTRQK